VVSSTTKAFGVGLETEVGVPFGATAWCDGTWNPSNVYVCPETPGTRQYEFGPTKRTYVYKNASGEVLGSDTASGSVTSKLGAGSYILIGTMDTSIQLRGPQAGANFGQLSGGWMDTLYIAAKSLKKGTPVTVGVKLALAPTRTGVACDAAGKSTGEVDFYAPFALGPDRVHATEVTGYCIAGSFKYYLYGNYHDAGTTAVGTIATAVGDSVPMYFAPSGGVSAGCPSNGCEGRIAAALEGSYELTITSITRGATYTAASGTKYN
jgi:hypothetical protein